MQTLVVRAVNDLHVQVKTSIVISRPVETVFAFVAEPENMPQWVDLTYDVSLTSAAPPIAVGTTFLGVGHFLGQRIESPHEVIAYTPNQQYVYRSSSGPLGFTFYYAFETEAAQTQVVFSGEVQAKAFFKVPVPDFTSGVKQTCALRLTPP